MMNKCHQNLPNQERTTRHSIFWSTADTPLDQAWHVLESHFALPKNDMEVQNEPVAQDNIQFHQNSILGF